MKANELVAGKKYWCGWASRYGWFVKIETRTWAGKTETKAVFQDICDVRIKCNVESVEKWVRKSR